MLLGLGLGPAAWAQQEELPLKEGEIRFRAGNALEQIIINGQKVRHFSGSVVAEQVGQTLYANDVYQYENGRTVMVGGVRIDQGEGKQITGDSLILVGKNRVAQVRGNVVYTEGTRTLTTQALDYDPKTGTAIYTTGGTINDNGTILTSRRGRYERSTGKMFFYGDVKMNGPEYSLATDSLHYNTASKMADFFGPTTITNQDGTVVSNRGSYNTETGVGKFAGRAGIESPDYRLEGDIVDFNRATGLGYAQGKVRMFAKKDSVQLFGDKGWYVRKRGKARIQGNALIKAPSGTRGDTLYIRSDSLNAINDSAAGQRTLIAKSRVKIYQRDFQGICDSLSYESADSTIRMYKAPVLWAGKNQTTADTIYARLENNRMDSLILIRNAFLISQDTLKNYNQVKGRRILADFANNKIQRAYVRGNGQSIYFAVDEEKLTLSGMNYIVCSNMVIRFDSANKLETITALVKPEAKFIPPKDIAEPERRLKGFNWNLSRRPTLKSVLQSPQTTIQPKKSGKSQKKSTTFKPAKAKARLRTK